MKTNIAISMIALVLMGSAALAAGETRPPISGAGESTEAAANAAAGERCGGADTNFRCTSPAGTDVEVADSQAPNGKPACEKCLDPVLTREQKVMGERTGGPATVNPTRGGNTVE